VTTIPWVHSCRAQQQPAPSSTRPRHRLTAPLSAAAKYPVATGLDNMDSFNALIQTVLCRGSDPQLSHRRRVRKDFNPDTLFVQSVDLSYENIDEALSKKLASRKGKRRGTPSMDGERVRQARVRKSLAFPIVDAPSLNNEDPISLVAPPTKPLNWSKPTSPVHQESPLTLGPSYSLSLQDEPPGSRKGRGAQPNDVKWMNNYERLQLYISEYGKMPSKRFVMVLYPA
jgi:hypothetical protein